MFRNGHRVLSHNLNTGMFQHNVSYHQ